MVHHVADTAGAPPAGPTYTTLAGRTLDLSRVTEEERAFFDRCYQEYRRGRTPQNFTDLANLVAGRENPLIQAAGGRVTDSVWEHPLYQAVRDLEDRLGIRVGELDAMPGDEIDRDPLDDRWLPATEAARRKDVTLKGLHKAILRGNVLARPVRPGGRRILVSERSLQRWQPDRARQLARRKAPA